MTLEQWLERIESCHPETIKLGLDRVRDVLHALELGPIADNIITVAGTNGKGSTVALMAAILQQAGYSCGCYTSPHLLRYNERVVINGATVADSWLCDAFARIEQARGDIPLTYFEYGTLSALLIFAEQQRLSGQPLDFVILEVGLGGRLDAVNVVDPDVAVLTTVSLDHQSWLGNSREEIAREKAGIFRAGVPAVCGEPDLPQVVADYAGQLGAPMLRRGVEFEMVVAADRWCWQGQVNGASRELSGLPLPQLPLANAATAIQALLTLLPELTPGAIGQGLLTASVPGRYQQVSEPFRMILDVAHNPESAAYLAAKLAAENREGQCYGLVGMLSDKDSRGVLSQLQSQVDHWSVCELNAARACPAQALKNELAALGIDNTECYGSVAEAVEAIQLQLTEHDRLLVFGSFFTVADALAWLERPR